MEPRPMIHGPAYSGLTANEIQRFSNLAGSDWDIAVIGAGPAGIIASLQLAARGLKVLLIDSKAFPRDKVCGGCLNQRAWQSLSHVAVRDHCPSIPSRLMAAGASEVNRLRLNCAGREARWTLPTMHAISRRNMDSLLITTAVEMGVVFLDDTAARVIDDSAVAFRSVKLAKSDATTCVIRARTVIAADGLGHTSLSDISAFASRVAPGARMGLGTIVTDEALLFPEHELTMSVGRNGYVGLTRVEEGRLNVAAAVDAAVMKKLGPSKTVAAILESCNLPVLESLRDARWTGTLPLTRQSETVAARRLFAIGDAAGYVEPFTGEGMSWAIVSAMQLCQLLETADLDDCQRLTATWIAQWRQQVRRKQMLCRSLATLLRYPKIAGYSLELARSLPWISQWLITRASGASLTHNYIGTA